MEREEERYSVRHNSKHMCPLLFRLIDSRFFENIGDEDRGSAYMDGHYVFCGVRGDAKLVRCDSATIHCDGQEMDKRLILWENSCGV